MYEYLVTALDSSNPNSLEKHKRESVQYLLDVMNGVKTGLEKAPDLLIGHPKILDQKTIDYIKDQHGIDVKYTHDIPHFIATNPDGEVNLFGTPVPGKPGVREAIDPHGMKHQMYNPALRETADAAPTVQDSKIVKTV